jgi:hypothetical protein
MKSEQLLNRAGTLYFVILYKYVKNGEDWSIVSKYRRFGVFSIKQEVGGQFL